jgi:hypothetical protein
LYYALGEDLHRRELASGTTATLTFASAIEAIGLAPGAVWIAAGTGVHRLLPQTSWTGPPPAAYLAYAPRITAVAAHDDRLLLGVGGEGVRIHRVAPAELTSSASLASPRASSLFTPGATLPLALADTDGVNAVRYLVNDRVVATSARAPFSASVPVPPWIANGQAFEVTAEIETAWGELHVSLPRRAAVQGEGMPGNPLLTVALSASGGFEPAPLVLSASVGGSAFALAQVELYLCDDASGTDCALVDRHRGPEYRFEQLPGAGTYWYKAAAIDIHGNRAESLLVSATRVIDATPPVQPTVTIEGFVKDGQPLEGYPFTVAVTVTDAGSGIESARLERDGVILATAASNGTFRAQEGPAVAGTYTYTVVARDRVGLETVRTVTFTTQSDAPAVVNVTAPATIREQSTFNVTVAATDDVGIVRLTLAWNGRCRTRRRA